MTSAALPRLLVADENIPHAADAFGTLGRVRTGPGRAFTAADVRATDALLVRSVTAVDEALLEKSAVRFVGSATIGTDHVDRGYLRRRGIAFAHAPGSNADSVADYVVAALVKLAAERGTALRGKVAGIIGCGNIGSRLRRRLPALGLRVRACDPPLAEAAEQRGEAHGFVSQQQVLAEAEIITCHVPLTREGPHATHHLIGAAELRQMRPGAWLVNTSRGPVVDGTALRAALQEEQVGAAVLDVWEGEPTPDLDLLAAVALGTPHVAGYAYDGKVRGTAMLYAALCDFLGERPTWDAEAVLAPADGETLTLTPPAAGQPEAAYLHACTRQMYPIAADDAALRRIADEPPEERGAHFSGLRKTYGRRREFSRFSMPEAAVPTAYRGAVAEGLGVRLG